MNTKRIREQKYFSLCRTRKNVLDSADKILLLVINQCPDTWYVMRSRLDTKTEGTEGMTYGFLLCVGRG
jgi:hypothetical protein